MQMFADELRRFLRCKDVPTSNNMFSTQSHSLLFCRFKFVEQFQAKKIVNVKTSCSSSETEELWSQLGTCSSCEAPSHACPLRTNIHKHWKCSRWASQHECALGCPCGWTQSIFLFFVLSVGWLRDLLVMKQFSLLEIVSAVAVLLAVVVESSRAFHGVG